MGDLMKKWCITMASSVFSRLAGIPSLSDSEDIYIYTQWGCI